MRQSFLQMNEPLVTQVYSRTSFDVSLEMDGAKKESKIMKQQMEWVNMAC